MADPLVVLLDRYTCSDYKFTRFVCHLFMYVVCISMCMCMRLCVRAYMVNACMLGYLKYKDSQRLCSLLFITLSIMSILMLCVL